MPRSQQTASRKDRQDRQDAIEETKETTDFTDGHGFKKTTLRLMPSAYAQDYGMTGRQQDGTACQQEKNQKNPVREAVLFRQSRIKRLKGALFNSSLCTAWRALPIA